MYILNLVSSANCLMRVEVGNYYYQNLIRENLVHFSPPRGPELENSLFTGERYIFRSITGWFTINFRIAATRKKKKGENKRRKRDVDFDSISRLPGCFVRSRNENKSELTPWVVSISLKVFIAGLRSGRFSLGHIVHAEGMRENPLAKHLKRRLQSNASCKERLIFALEAGQLIKSFC